METKNDKKLCKWNNLVKHVIREGFYLQIVEMLQGGSERLILFVTIIAPHLFMQGNVM